MKLCWLGIHKWDKWQDYGETFKFFTQRYSEFTGQPLGNPQFDSYRRRQKRTCQGCGITKTRTYKI